VYNKITNKKNEIKNMIFWGILTFASILSNAEARMTDVSFEEGESASPTFTRPETKREEKKREQLTS
jgi:hypothetical protein